MTSIFIPSFADELHSNNNECNKNDHLSHALQDFFSVVGGVTSTPINTDGLTDGGLVARSTESYSSSVDEEDTLIFESKFDLSEERLRYVFDKFDTDEDGKISYDNLRRGLEFLAGLRDSTTLFSDRSFDDLMAFLDTDGSGDVSFTEFSEGILLLMLRALFYSDDAQGRVGVPFEILDYDITRLERKTVGRRREGGPTSSSSTEEHNLEERAGFFFNRRPDWIHTRWSVL